MCVSVSMYSPETEQETEQESRITTERALQAIDRTPLKPLIYLKKKTTATPQNERYTKYICTYDICIQ